VFTLCLTPSQLPLFNHLVPDSEGMTAKKASVPFTGMSNH